MPKPTSPKEWKKNQSIPMELPSGNYLRIRRMSMQTLMATGKMPNRLMSIMKSAVDKGQGIDENKLAGEAIDDPKLLQDMVKFYDDLTMMMAVEPVIHPVPPTEQDRADDLLYVDEIDDEDKAFLFQYISGGVTDAESFRQQSQADLAAVSGLQNVELPALATAESD
ncbi:DUF7391 family protein [Streptomyces sp. NPDC002248]